MSGTTAKEYESNIERISTPDLVVSYLRRLQDAHTLLKVTVPGYKQVCSSILLVINEKEKFLVLDKLHPEPGHVAFMKNRQCRVHAQHQGVDMGFVANLDQLIGGEDDEAYRVQLPAELLYHQRRSAYRAAIGAGKYIEVMLTDKNGSVLPGSLYNISTGGMCVNLQKSVIDKLNVGDILPACRFEAANGKIIETIGEVRNIKIDDDKKAYRIGMSFIEIAPQELRAIQKFVLNLEREQIKRSR